MNQVAKSLIIAGILLIVIGLGIIYRDKFPFLKQLGQLPGDILIERENFKIYFPVVTSALIGLILSFFLWLFKANK